MVRDNAKMLAFNDLGLPSPVAYLDQGEHNPGHVPHLHWDVAYFFDNMRENGFEKGRANKFYKVMVDIVGKKHFAAGQVEVKGVAPRCSKCIWEKFVVWLYYNWWASVMTTVSSRPGVLHSNLCTSLALVICLIAFVNMSVKEDKASFLLSYLKTIGFMVAPWITSVGGLDVQFPEGRQETLHVSSSGQIAFGSFVKRIHGGIYNAWAKTWEDMYTAGHLSTDWQDDLHMVDIMMFVTCAERFRRSRLRVHLGTSSLTLLSQFKDWMAVLLSHCLDQFLLSTHQECAQTAKAAARKFKKYLSYSWISFRHFLVFTLVTYVLCCFPPVPFLGVVVVK